MASEYTPNYNLDLYASADKPNLRDQYNAAMGKIDVQMKTNADNIVNANASIGTLQTQMAEANSNIDTLQTQMTEANSNINTLQTQMATANENISAIESTVEAHGTQITDVQQTADNALSLAQTNESDIGTLDNEMNQVQQGVTNLQSATRTQTIYQAQQWDFEAHGLMMIKGMPQNWGSEGDTFTLDAAIPSWANWIDVYLTTQGSSFYNEGASSVSDTTSFASPLIVQTFPTKIAKKAASSSAIEIQPITDFCFTLPPMMGTNYQGAQTVTFGAIPFRITGNQLTQNMGLAASSGGYEQWKNAFSGVGYTYTSNDPTITNSQSSALIYKIVARA